MAATDSENSISDNFAPNWLPYFSPEGDILPDVVFHVDCQICDKKLAISQPVDDENEPFVVLPCGHAFGLSCIKTWLRRSPNATCPSCRSPLWYSECEHYITPKPIQLGVDNMREAISKRIVGQDGLPSHCRGCRERHARGEGEPEVSDNNRMEMEISSGGRSQRVEVGANRTLVVDLSGNRPPSARQGAPRPGQIQVTYVPAPTPLRNPFPGPQPPTPDDVVQGRFPPRRRRSAVVTGMPNAPDFTGDSADRRRDRRERREAAPGGSDERDPEIDEMIDRVARRIGR